MIQNNNNKKRFMCKIQTGQFEKYCNYFVNKKYLLKALKLFILNFFSSPKNLKFTPEISWISLKNVLLSFDGH
jgi:hypothetical protein